MTDRSFRCSHASEAEGEPLVGTASTITNWLLVEHAGPWGEEALRHARLPAGLGDVLRRRERELKIRVLLIRRHGRGAAAKRSCFAIHTGPDRPWIEHADLEDVRDVAAIDLDALGRGASVGMTPTEDPLFAVCTHGRRDPCCAERGRPLAAALSEAFPEQTWESTHIGGDRFAGNMIAFPHGFYFGRVDAARRCRVATGYVGGTIDLEHLRGRSCRPDGRAGGRALPPSAPRAHRNRRRDGHRCLPRRHGGVLHVHVAARIVPGGPPSRRWDLRSGSPATPTARDDLHASSCWGSKTHETRRRLSAVRSSQVAVVQPRELFSRPLPVSLGVDVDPRLGSGGGEPLTPANDLTTSTAGFGVPSARQRPNDRSWIASSSGGCSNVPWS